MKPAKRQIVAVVIVFIISLIMVSCLGVELNLGIVLLLAAAAAAGLFVRLWWES